MSVQFGLAFQGTSDNFRRELLRMALPTKRLSPERAQYALGRRVGMGMQALHDRDICRQNTPYCDASGNMICFNGRLDNRKQILVDLSLSDKEIEDAALVLKSFLMWGEACFARFIGDWAIAIWSEYDHALYLARDHAGTRTLYFEESQGALRWATFVETLVLNRGSRKLNRTFAARYLSGLPVGRLTPYEGIRAVPPGCFVRSDEKSLRYSVYWHAARSERITYRNDREYEEHFRFLFEQSVARRRAAGERPIVHLSGGMDSTSILCLADVMADSGQSALAEKLGSISYFDPSEPHWDERPYVEAVEAHRKQRGVHLELSLSSRTFVMPSIGEENYWLPGLDSSSRAWESRLDEAVRQVGDPIILTGHGGDEVLGGSPTPLPELADLIAAARFPAFFRRTYDWCLSDRTALVTKVVSTSRYLVDVHGQHILPSRLLPRWIKKEARHDLADEDTSFSGPRARWGTPPSSLGNAKAWALLLDQLPHLLPGSVTRYEYRYPYLDRELVEFLFSIPREQLVRPGRRRSLMRRALKNVVPDVILERKRKAYCARGPLLAVAAAVRLRSGAAVSSLSDLDLVDDELLSEELQEVKVGGGIEHIGAMMRLLSFESWLERQIQLGHLQ